MSYAFASDYEILISFPDDEFPNEDICAVNEKHELFISQVWNDDSKKRLYDFDL